MAKRLSGRVTGMVKKVGLPVAAKLAERAAAALESADRVLDERLQRARAKQAAASSESPTGKKADAPARPRRVVRKGQLQPAGKTKRAPAKKAAAKPAGPKVKRGQKHSHHR
jgi:hypothetical protein